MSKNETPSAQEPGFEQALTKLETIVREMEGGELSLDQMMSHFEQGTDLIKYCTTKLNEVERKIEVLVKKNDQVVAEPYSP